MWLKNVTVIKFSNKCTYQYTLFNIMVYWQNTRYIRILALKILCFRIFYAYCTLNIIFE